MRSLSPNQSCPPEVRIAPDIGHAGRGFAFEETLETAQALTDFRPLSRFGFVGIKTHAPSLTVFAFSVVLALMFFVDGIHADFTALSNDQYNIIPVCAKKDNPNLFQGDEIVGNLKGVNYYTPFFVDTVRLLAWPNHDYFRALNLLVLITTVVYMFGWWLLFSLFGNKWIAAVGAFFVRGILWVPGNEFWGIAGIWTMVPRTVFLALLPWVIWLWFRYRRSYVGWIFVSFLCGLLANVHPISGVAVAVGICGGEFAWTLAESKGVKNALLKCLAGGTCMLAGAFPFVWTYLSQVGSKTGIDIVEFDQALRMRLKPFFFNPLIYLEGWLRPQLSILIFLPWLACILSARRYLAEFKTTFLALGVFALGCLMVSAAPFPAEAILDRLGYHPRFAFQLVRAGKYALVPSIILTASLCALACGELSRRLKHGALLVGITCIFAITFTLLARQPVFNNVPILGDDVSRFLWPAWTGRRPSNPGEEDNVRNLVPAMNWIKANTASDAKFVGPRQIRMGALRSVVHEWAGAVMLVEGDPNGFIEATRRERQLRSPDYQDPIKRSKLIASWGADYWVTSDSVPGLLPAYAESGWFIYDLRGLRSSLDLETRSSLKAAAIPGSNSN